MRTATLGWGELAAPARASEHAMMAMGTLCFRAFLLAQFFSLTRQFWAQHLGSGMLLLASLAGLLSTALLIPAVLAYGFRTGSVFGRLAPGAHVWVASILVLSAVLFFVGWLVKGYDPAVAAHDLAPYLTIMGCVVLGSMPEVWEDSKNLILVLFAFAIVVNLLGMTEITHVVSEEHSEDRAGITTVAYRTQGALDFWPLLFLTARLRKPRTALFIFGGVFFILAQQILFQKRSPTVRVVLFMLVFLFVLPRLTRKDRAAEKKRSEAKIRLLFVSTLGAGAVLALAIAPWLFLGQAAGLADRLSGSRYSGGAAGMLTWENERFFEASMFFKSLRAEEVVMGRGFGGYFIPEARHWGLWLDDVGQIGRRQLHVGFLMPFFKGGVALALLYYGGVVAALYKGLRKLDRPVGAAAFFVVLIHVVFLMQEGWFIMSLAYDLTLVGLCLGYLLSAERSPAQEQRFEEAFS
jgi:hypothetical protein